MKKKICKNFILNEDSLALLFWKWLVVQSWSKKTRPLAPYSSVTWSKKGFNNWIDFLKKVSQQDIGLSAGVNVTILINGSTVFNEIACLPATRCLEIVKVEITRAQTLQNAFVNSSSKNGLWDSYLNFIKDFTVTSPLTNEDLKAAFRSSLLLKAPGLANLKVEFQNWIAFLKRLKKKSKSGFCLSNFGSSGLDLRLKVLVGQQPVVQNHWLFLPETDALEVINLEIKRFRQLYRRRHRNKK